MTPDTDRLFREAARRADERRTERRRKADDILAVVKLDRLLCEFDLFAPLQTKTERFTLSLGWCCLIGCAVFGWVYL